MIPVAATCELPRLGLVEVAASVSLGRDAGPRYGDAPDPSEVELLSVRVAGEPGPDLRGELSDAEYGLCVLAALEAAEAACLPRMRKCLPRMRKWTTDDEVDLLRQRERDDEDEIEAARNERDLRGG